MAATTDKRKTLDYIGSGPNTGDWQGRHAQAIHSPQGAERAIVGLLKAWLDYANGHEARYDSRIGDDYVLGPPWAQIGAGLRQLLNGESGRLDCGTLDSIIYNTLNAEGFNPDLM